MSSSVWSPLKSAPSRPEVPGYRLELTPFGGIKDSGLGYKEGVQEAIKSFTNRRPTRCRGRHDFHPGGPGRCCLRP